MTTQKALTGITLVLMAVVTVLIFWAAISPQTFFQSVSTYPTVNDTAVQLGLFTPQTSKIFQATTSEPVRSVNGQVIISGVVWTVVVANNDIDRVQGRSNKSLLYPQQGMLFAFNDLGKHLFWMKDMLIPLDMVFFDNNWKIIDIESNLQPDTFPNTYGGNINSQYIMEVNANEASAYGLKVGDRAILLNN